MTRISLAILVAGALIAGAMIYNGRLSQFEIGSGDVKLVYIVNRWSSSATLCRLSIGSQWGPSNTCDVISLDVPRR
jgi:hypothetical protein